MMRSTDIISLARRHLDYSMDFPGRDTAELALADAENACAAGFEHRAQKLAARSLYFTVGPMHPDYIATAK